jgi:hypothetical protein
VEKSLTSREAGFSFVTGRPAAGSKWFYRVEEIDGP